MPFSIDASAQMRSILSPSLFAILVTAALSLQSCSYFPEASFELASESRLPRWFTLPPNLSRSDITVTMTYYVKPPGRIAMFKLLDTKKHKLAEVTGTLEGLEPRHLKNPRPGFPPGYPIYEVVSVNGAKEIIEHRRMDSVFYLNDDAAVWDELTGGKK
jgi:hypothetical protein